MGQHAEINRVSSAYVDSFKVLSVIGGIVLASFYLLSSILLPIIISFTLYALLQPFTNYLVRRNINHSAAIIFMLILMLFFSILAISIALPQLLEQATFLKNKMPGIFNQLEGLLNLYSQKLAATTGIELNVSNIVVSILSQSSSLGNAILLKISEQVFAITLSMILVPLLTYFILKDFKQVRNKALNWLPNSSFELGWLI